MIKPFKELNLQLSRDKLRDIWSRVSQDESKKVYRYGYKIHPSYDPYLMKLWEEFSFLQDEIFFLKTNSELKSLPIHKDGDEGEVKIASLNFPIENCNSQSVTSWYEITNPQVKYEAKTKFLTDYESLEKVHEYVFDCDNPYPTLLKVDEWHSIENKSDSPRILLKWDLMAGMSWAEALEIFSSNNSLSER